METLHLVLRRFTPIDFQDFLELIRDKQASVELLKGAGFSITAENTTSFVNDESGKPES